MKLKESSDSTSASLSMCRKPQVLSVAPRRHQALKAREMLMQIGRFYEVHCETLIGGMPSFQVQCTKDDAHDTKFRCIQNVNTFIQCISKLRGGLDVITGTPGKLADMCVRGELNAGRMSNLIALALDSAHELTRGASMRCQMSVIARALPPKKRIRVLWMGTSMSPYTGDAARRSIRLYDRGIRSMHDEKELITTVEPQSLEHVQRMVHVQRCMSESERRPYSKIDGVAEIIRLYETDSMVVFWNTRQAMRACYQRLCTDAQLVRPRSTFFMLDGHCSNRERDHVLRNFERIGGVLISTDLVAEGVSFGNVNIIVNADMPRFDPVSSYVSRAGVSISRDKVIVVSIVKARDERSGGDRLCPPSRDELAMQSVKMTLKVKFEQYRSFTRKRRHNKQCRGDSVCFD